MSGTILENLSNRKLCVVIAIILIIQLLSFFIGAFIAPSPSNTEQVIGSMCIPEDYTKLSIPRHKIRNGEIISKNCKKFFNIGFQNITSPVVFAFQLPLPRGGFELDYSRWMSNLVTILSPDIIYRSDGFKGTGNINMVIEMKVTLAVKDINQKNWTIYSKKDVLKRTLNCKLDSNKLEDGEKYDCENIQLFELQSLYYDYYLINIEFLANSELANAQLEDLALVAIHQNGGFTKVWLSLKTVFTIMTLLTFIWYYKRLGQLHREITLLEKLLIVLGICITQLNIPIEFLSLFWDIRFMNFLSDIRQGILFCSLLCFWLIFTGEHLLDGVHRSRLSSYYNQLIIVLTTSISLLVFDSIERGIQWIDPFFTIWEVDPNIALIFIIIAIIFVSLYFIYLTYQVWLVLRTISTKERALPSMSSTRRLIYQGVIYRFKFLLLVTLVLAALTIIAHLLSQMDDVLDWDDESYEKPLEWHSAMFTTVYSMCNCYIITLLILYAPSHKGLRSSIDNMSEEIEFNRLTSDGDIAPKDESAENVQSEKTEMQLLQELISKQSLE